MSKLINSSLDCYNEKQEDEESDLEYMRKLYDRKYSSIPLRIRESHSKRFYFS